MAIKYYQYGELQTVVAVHRIAMVLQDEWGNWTSIPAAKVAPSESHTRFFKTENKDSYVLGPKGYVKYESADGAVFTMGFDCPTSRANVCTGEVSAGTPYTIESYVPSGGHDGVKYQWKIQRKSFAFFDAPVFAADLLSAQKCDLVPNSTIVEAIDGRRGVYLRDVFAVADLPDEAKLWCATHDLFLTASSKAMLTRDLAMKTLSDRRADRIDGDLVDRVLAHNVAVAEGEVSAKTGRALRSELATRAHLSNNGGTRAGDLESVVAALALDDLAYGWSIAVQAYAGAPGSEGRDERLRDLVALVEDRL